MIVLSVAYPFAFYLLSESVQPLLFAAAACALLALRAFWGNAGWMRALRWPLLAAAGLIAALALVDEAVAAKAYPVALSLVLALAFGLSLRQPKSLVERFAEISGDAQGPAARLYCRRVTLLWTVWLAINALICAVLALAGSLEAWTLWTGLLSYLAIGLIFSAEYLVRRIVRRGHAAG
jgi:uncharacterized membrane protein